MIGNSLEITIGRLRELNQINIYTVNEYWCVQLFDLDVSANDYDAFPCVENECIFECSDKILLSALQKALNWSLFKLNERS